MAYKITKEVKRVTKNTDLEANLSEIILDREQYYQELLCAFTVIKKNGLEGEYLGAVQCLVHNQKIKKTIIDCITDGNRVLGKKIDDFNQATRDFIKKYFISLRREFNDEKTAELYREIAALKNKLDEVSKTNDVK